MWRVYDLEWFTSFGQPYEAYSASFGSLISELEYIGIFLGRSGSKRTFAVLQGGKT
jgi:hypothetical protein